jgi:multidrug resistance protein, MATE family
VISVSNFLMFLFITLYTGH